MKQNRITTITLASFILVALIACGVIGYLNDSGRTYPFPTDTSEPLPTETPATIDLVYCTSPVSLCIVSFGQDNAGNMLIAIKNNIPGLAEFYAKLTSTDASELYPCQKVQFTSDIYYCTGNQIPDGTMVTMEVYSKSDDQLVASGRIPVSAEATPTPVTIEPTGTATVTATQTALTATSLPSETPTPPPATVLPSETSTSPTAKPTVPAYPYPYP
jgi:hypothetical protein